MKIKLIYVLLALCVLLSACNCSSVKINGKVTNKIYESSTTSVCTKSGNIYIPSHGGQCMGLIELIPEKYIIEYSFDDGSQIREKVTENKYNSTEIGQETSKTKLVCK